MPKRLALAIVAAIAVGGCSTPKDPSQGAASAQSMQPQQSVQLAQQQEATPQQRSQLRTDLAAGYYERGQMDVALEELAEAVRIDPANARAYNVYGLIYAVLGEDAKAEQSFQRALSLAPNDSDIHHNWGWYLCTHGKPRESLAEFETALRNPLYRSPEIALVNAARCATSLGDVKTAEAYYRRAVAASPADPNAAYGLARLAYKGARYQEARDRLRPAVMQAAPSAEALYLGMCIERELGDRQSELSYISQLRNRYPESAETKAITAGSCQ